MTTPQFTVPQDSVADDTATLPLQTAATEKASLKNRLKAWWPTSLPARALNKIAEGFRNFFNSIKDKFSSKNDEKNPANGQDAATKLEEAKPSAKVRIEGFITSAKIKMTSVADSCKKKFKQITRQDVLKAAAVILTGILPGIIYFAGKAGYAKYQAHKNATLAAAAAAEKEKLDNFANQHANIDEHLVSGNQKEFSTPLHTPKSANTSGNLYASVSTSEQAAEVSAIPTAPALRI